MSGTGGVNRSSPSQKPPKAKRKRSKNLDREVEHDKKPRKHRRTKFGGIIPRKGKRRAAAAAREEAKL